jgi:DNA-binding transcriptional ArsR family regulator
MQQMSLSPVKYAILETMLLQDKPARATKIAEEAGKEFPSVMMHIIGLTRMGYAYSPEKGQYAITEKGKQVLGLNEITMETANAILAQVSSDKEFYFYENLGKPLGLCAQSLQDFSDKISSVNAASIEFHMNRGDFGAWFAGLGDAELAKKATLLKEKKLNGEELSRKLREMVANRCTVLASIAGHTVPSV